MDSVTFCPHTTALLNSIVCKEMGRSPQCQWQRSKHLTSACFAIPWNSTSTKQLRTNSNFEVHLSSSSPFVPNTTFHHLLQVCFWPCWGPHVFPWCYVAVGTARQSLGRRVLEDVPSEALRRTRKRVKTQALMMLLDDFITSELFLKRECGELFFFFLSSYTTELLISGTSQFRWFDKRHGWFSPHDVKNLEVEKIVFSMCLTEGWKCGWKLSGSARPWSIRN